MQRQQCLVGGDDVLAGAERPLYQPARDAAWKQAQACVAGEDFARLKAAREARLGGV